MTQKKNKKMMEKILIPVSLLIEDLVCITDVIKLIMMLVSTMIFLKLIPIIKSY